MPSNYNLPTELTDAIISFLHANTYALPACACVHSSWTSSARMHLYRDIYLWGLSTWIRLGMALQHTPELVPLIKHITIDGGGRIPRNLTLDEWQKWIFPLSGLLDHLESLTVRTLELHASPDPVTDFLHTHFPRVKRLRIDSVVTPDRATLQRVLLSPRAALKSVALSRISLAKQDESSLGLISYSEVELDGSAWPAVESLLSEAAASKPVTTPQSHIRALKLNGLQLKHFPSMAAALRALGSSLESLEVRVRNTVHGATQKVSATMSTMKAYLAFRSYSCPAHAREQHAAPESNMVGRWLELRSPSARPREDP
jgi:hypothetical protein